MSSILHLPEEIIYQILSYLNTEHIRRLGILNKEFLSLTCSDTLYYYLCRRYRIEESILQELYVKHGKWKIVDSFVFNRFDEKSCEGAGLLKPFGKYLRKIKRPVSSGCNPSCLLKHPFRYSGETVGFKLLKNKGSWYSIGAGFKNTPVIDSFVGDNDKSCGMYAYDGEKSSIYISGKTNESRHSNENYELLTSDKFCSVHHFGVGDIIRIEYLENYTHQDKTYGRVIILSQLKKQEGEKYEEDVVGVVHVKNEEEKLYGAASLGFGVELEIVRDV